MMRHENEWTGWALPLSRISHSQRTFFGNTNCKNYPYPHLICLGSPEVELRRSEGVQYASGKKQKTNTNSSIKDVAGGPKWKQCLAVDVSGSESKVQCHKAQYCVIT